MQIVNNIIGCNLSSIANEEFVNSDIKIVIDNETKIQNKLFWFFIKLFLIERLTSVAITTK